MKLQSVLQNYTILLKYTIQFYKAKSPLFKIFFCMSPHVDSLLLKRKKLKPSVKCFLRTKTSPHSLGGEGHHAVWIGCRKECLLKLSVISIWMIFFVQV